jgi:hypothetical protein
MNIHSHSKRAQKVKPLRQICARNLSVPQKFGRAAHNFWAAGRCQWLRGLVARGKAAVYHGKKRAPWRRMNTGDLPCAALLSRVWEL